MSATQTNTAIRPITVGIDEVRKFTGLATTTIYKLMAEGKLKSCRVGARRLVFYDSVEQLLRDNAA